MNNHSDELIHYGIPGMKWGHRKTAAYKNAKADYKNAKRKYFKSSVVRVGSMVNNDMFKRSEYNTAAGKKYMTRQADRNKAYSNKVNAQAKLKSISTKKTNKLGYNKAEFNTYVKGLNKSGIPNSQLDRNTNGKGTTLYNSIARKKGKTYANAVLSKTGNKKANAIIIGGLATVGLSAAKYYIKKQNK